MGYLLATLGLIAVLILLFALLPRFLRGAEGSPPHPQAEKEQMNEPQEEFVDDLGQPSRPASPPPPRQNS